MKLDEELAILAEAAKHDAPCASSVAPRRRSGDRKLRRASGQSTQVIVGADGSTDAVFLERSEELHHPQSGEQKDLSVASRGESAGFTRNHLPARSTRAGPGSR